MKDEILIKKIKEHGADTDSVRDMLLDLLMDGEITTQQVMRLLDEPNEAWPLGFPFSDISEVKITEPSFAVSVVTEFKSLSGNEQAFCY